MRTEGELSVALCADRHNTPALDGALFNFTITDPNNFDALYRELERRVPSNINKIVLYVTGLSQALTTVVKYCVAHQITLVTKHWDNPSQTYFSDTLFQFENCGHCGVRYLLGQQYCRHKED